MSVALAVVLHALSAVVWVGGMFFAWLLLRPASGALEAGARLALWQRVLGRFLAWVAVAVLLLFATGFYMVAALGGMGRVSAWVHVMLALGVAMTLLFGWAWWEPFRRLRAASGAADRKTAGNQLRQIARLVGVNLTLGLVTVAIGALASLHPVG
ncbi:MAG TPA: CopD family protein [Nevskiaceae bacterium]